MLALAVVALAGPTARGAGQAPPSFAALVLPAGTNPAAAAQRGKILFIQTGGRVHVFSAFTRDWRSVDASPNAVVRHANDWLLVRDGTRWTAFSSMRGSFETLQVSPSARVLNPGSQRNDAIVLVQDGGMVHAFSGLVGEWIRLPVTVGGTAWIVVQRNVALVVDGGAAWALGAAARTWIAQPIAGVPGRVHADGSAGTVESGGTVWGFSAQRERWSGFPALVGAEFTASGDVAVWNDGIVCIAYSGVRGRFDGFAAGTRVAVRTEQQMAIAQAGVRTWLFSAALGRWTATATATPASVDASAAVAVLSTPGQVVGYSAVRGSLAPLAVSPAFVIANWAVAAVTDGDGVHHFFSAYTGQWSDAPPGPGTAAPVLGLNAGTIETRTGVAAFSARTGRFVDLPVMGAHRVHLDAASALVAVEEPGRFSVFDARVDAWRSVPRRSAGAMSVWMWRTTLLGQDGPQILGFGAQHGDLESFTPAGSPVSVDARSESGRIELTGTLVGYSAVPDLMTLGQVPAFRRLQPRGAPLDLHVHGPAGAATAALIGLPTAAMLATPLGPLAVDLGNVTAGLPPGVLPAAGSLAWRLTTPRNATVIGVQLALQALVVPMTGSPYLTRMCTVLVH